MNKKFVELLKEAGKMLDTDSEIDIILTEGTWSSSVSVIFKNVKKECFLDGENGNGGK